MNFDGLETAYWTAQSERLEQLRAKVASRAAVTAGRVVPDDDDLTIGTGRRLDGATIMFLDICGFSKRRSITASEQEMMLRVLNLFITEMIRIIEDYGGFVEKNTGDGLMAYFENYPAGTPGENSTQRAVACALTMHSANALLISPILRASDVVPIDYRVMVERGPITVARIGAARRFNATVAIGNAANFAGKMLRLIQAGDIGLGDLAWRSLPELWRARHTALSPISTGWTYENSPAPYPLYLYLGRWSRLI